ncbi:MAG: carboxypeptidase-like regulatory domain-containing protein [Bacteroidota bacterium]
METRHELKFSRDLRLEDLMAKNETTFNGIPLFDVEKLIFDACMVLLKAAAEKYGYDTSTFSKSKMSLKEAMGVVVITFAERASVQANQLHHYDLENMLSKALSYIKGASALNAFNRATALMNIMDDNKTTLTIIETSDITSMRNAIDLFSDSMNLPKEEIKGKKAETTDVIADLLKDVDGPVARMGKLIDSYKSPIQGKWLENAKIGKSSGIRHIDLWVKYADSVTGNRLGGVSTTISDGVKTIVKKSSRDGNTKFTGLDSGNYSVLSEKKSHITQTQNNIGVDGKKVVRIEIKMVKK